MESFVAYFEYAGEEFDYYLRAESKAGAEARAKRIAEDKGLKFLRVEED